jgi:hypothetical protein
MRISRFRLAIGLGAVVVTVIATGFAIFDRNSLVGPILLLTFAMISVWALGPEMPKGALEDEQRDGFWKRGSDLIAIGVLVGAASALLLKSPTQHERGIVLGVFALLLVAGVASKGIYVWNRLRKR